jgi:hypothetical protein
VPERARARAGRSPNGEAVEWRACEHAASITGNAGGGNRSGGRSGHPMRLPARESRHQRSLPLTERPNAARTPRPGCTWDAPATTLLKAVAPAPCLQLTSQAAAAHRAEKADTMRPRRAGQIQQRSHSAAASQGAGTAPTCQRNFTAEPARAGSPTGCRLITRPQPWLRAPSVAPGAARRRPRAADFGTAGADATCAISPPPYGGSLTRDSSICARFDRNRARQRPTSSENRPPDEGSLGRSHPMVATIGAIRFSLARISPPGSARSMRCA